MEKLQQLYNGLKESGDVTVGFDEFASYYSNPENKQALYGGLKELGDVTVPFEEFDSYYFGGEKKKTQPQAGGGVLLPASSQQSGMVSGVTPTAKVSVAVESPAPPVAGAPGTPQAIAEQQSVDVAQAKEAKRQKTIATVANGLGNLAQLLEETGQPAYDAKSWKTQLEGTLSSPSAGKTQDERDVVALQRAYRLFTKSGLKRGGGGEGLYQGPFPAKMLIEKGIGTDRAYDISQAMEETWRALGEAEENLRKTDPQRWQQMMNAESDQYYKSRGISNGDKQLKFRALEKNDVGFKEDGLLSKEAMLRMQAKDWFDQAEKMTKSLGLAVDDPRRREMQIVFQDPYASLNPRMTVARIVGEPFAIHGLPPGGDRDRLVAELLDAVLGGDSGEVGAQLRRRGEFSGPAGLGIVEHHVAHVGQFEVSRIDHFHTEHVVPS